MSESEQAPNGLDAILDLSKDEQVDVEDVDTNLVRVDISIEQGQPLGILGEQAKLTIFIDAVVTQGLHIVGNDTDHLVIESAVPGQTFDIDQVNHILGTLSYTPAHLAGVTTDVFPHITITATDSAGTTDTQTISSSSIATEARTTSTAFGELYEEPLGGDQGSNYGELAGHDGIGMFGQHPGEHRGVEPNTDAIDDFNSAPRSAGGDVLDLRDLLHADRSSTAVPSKATTLLHFLDFDTQSQPGSTVIHVSARGNFQTDGAAHSDSSGCDDQRHIVLSNVDIRSALGLDALANDHQIIAELVQRGKLLVDNC
jgi:hypothetical protein